MPKALCRMLPSQPAESWSRALCSTKLDPVSSMRKQLKLPTSTHIPGFQGSGQHALQMLCHCSQGHVLRCQLSRPELSRQNSITR